MPYIVEKRRTVVLETLAAANAGELNYLFFVICNLYLGSNPGYKHFNDVIGALEGCKLEIARRRLYDHEDKAIERNGDIL